MTSSSLNQFSIDGIRKLSRIFPGPLNNLGNLFVFFRESFLDIHSSFVAMVNAYFCFFTELSTHHYCFFLAHFNFIFFFVLVFISLYINPVSFSHYLKLLSQTFSPVSDPFVLGIFYFHWHIASSLLS